MLQCAKPIWIGKEVQSPVGCGQCMPCRINRRREWAGRILLEAAGYAEMSSFVTLTYNEETVPWGPVDDDWPAAEQQILDKRGFRAWVKRVRRLHAIPLRFFGVGEYGTLTQRPHYHAILFGVPPHQAKLYCDESWPNGFNSVAELNPQRAAYTASYVVKKWMQKDTQWLRGRPPEFAVSSRRPGIGVAGLLHIVAAFQTRSGAATVAAHRVTRTVCLNGKVYPLDRTMTRHMLEGLGLPSNYEFSKSSTTSPAIQSESHEKAQVEKARLQDAKLRRKAKIPTAQQNI